MPAARRPIIAIDGPAGSGKSTTARAVAAALGYAHVDSGAVYRACTLVALDTLGAPEDWTPAALVGRARATPVTVRAQAGVFEVLIGGLNAEPQIRAERVTRAVSHVAAMAEVRDYVNALLREASRGGGVVMDGRDIGTVVFPDAEVKVFLTADADERARRRLRERGEGEGSGAVARESRALQGRDRRDSTREVAPLAAAEGAVVIDTSRLAFADQVARVVALAEEVTRGRP